VLGVVIEASSGVDASISIGVSTGMPLSALIGMLRGRTLVVGIFGAREIGVSDKNDDSSHILTRDDGRHSEREPERCRKEDKYRWSRR
jgi:hypothetical protein